MMNKTRNLKIYGIHAIEEALDAGKNLDTVFIQRGSNNDRIAGLQKSLRAQKVPVKTVPVEKLDRLTNQTHQGIVAFLSPITYQRTSDVLMQVFDRGETPLFLILDCITDVRNLGAIARSAEIAGVHAIIVPTENTAQINEDAIKTSSGALHKIPVCRERNLLQTLEYLKKSGLQVVAAIEKASKLINEGDLTLPTAVIIGSEDNGINPDLLKEADHAIRIPMRGTIGSFNVSVAAGIILYEVMRQRKD